MDLAVWASVVKFLRAALRPAVLLFLSTSRLEFGTMLNPSINEFQLIHLTQTVLVMQMEVMGDHLGVLMPKPLLEDLDRYLLTSTLRAEVVAKGVQSAVDE